MVCVPAEVEAWKKRLSCPCPSKASWGVWPPEVQLRIIAPATDGLGPSAEPVAVGVAVAVGLGVAVGVAVSVASYSAWCVACRSLSDIPQAWINASSSAAMSKERDFPIGTIRSFVGNQPIIDR